MRTVSTAQLVATHGLLSVSCMIVLYPVLWVVKMALTPSQSFSMSANPIPTSVTFDNFYYLFTMSDGLLWRQLFNSLAVSLVTTLIGVLLACTAAYAFSRFRFPGRTLGMAGFLITQMFPGVVMAIPLYILMDRLHLLNSLTGLILVYSTSSLPFCVWMLKGYFDTIPKDLEEAAVMDGATPWMIFWQIILPLAKPAIVVTALFSFMTAWNEFILAATFLSDEKMYTLPVVLQRFVGDYSTQWGYFAAGAILVSLPVMLLFFRLQKYLIGGLTAGAVKG
jgi:arabinogalactan oligomer / maltooligosaccharide transport system permease protein